MEYTKMIMLIEKARLVGASDLTGYVNQILDDVFHEWLSMQELGDITDEEEERVKQAFDEGFGINPPCPCQQR